MEDSLFDPSELGFGGGKNDKAAALRAVMHGATSTDPAQHASAMQTARRLEVPAQVVLNSKQPLEQLNLQSIDFDNLANNYPKTSEYLLADPDHAKISRRDLDNMLRTEEALRDVDLESKGLFDKRTRGTVIQYLKDEGYDIAEGAGDEIAKSRPAPAAPPSRSLPDQVALGFAEAFDPAIESQLDKERFGKRVELPTDKKGAIEAFMDEMQKGSFAPYLSALPEAVELQQLYSIGRRAERNEMSADDWATLLKVDNEIRRGSTYLGKATEILVGIPAFAGELASTWGLGAAASQVARKGLRKTGLHAIRKQLGKRAAIAAQTAIGGAARAATLAATAGSVRTAVGTYRNLLPQFSGLSEDQFLREEGILQAAFKETENTFLEALGKAYGDQFIETATELMGVKISKVYSAIGKKTGLSAMQAAIAARWFKLNPTKSSSVFVNQLRKYGWDGILEEWTEERIASLMRMSLGWEEWGVDVEGQAAELVAFSVLGGLGFAAHAKKSRAYAVDAAARAQAQVDFLEDLRTLSEDSETRALIPGLQALQAQLAAQNGPVENLFFPLENWNAYWESKGLSGRNAAIQLGVPEADFDGISEISPGANIRIPIGQYIEQVASSEHHEELSRIARLAENSPNLVELEQIVQASVESHLNMVSLAQSRVEAEAEKDALLAESEQLKEELAALQTDAAFYFSGESIAGLEAQSATTTDPLESERINLEIARVRELQDRGAKITSTLADIVARTQVVNDKLTEIRRQELSFTQAAIADSQESKDLADKIFGELKNVYADVPGQARKYKPTESAIRLQSALASRMVANLAARVGVSVPDFMDRFVLTINGSGISLPVSRASLAQSKVNRLESEYAEAIARNNMQEAQRITDQIAAVAGIRGVVPPVEINADGSYKTLADRFGTTPLRKANIAELQANYQTMAYSMEMIMGNNSGSPLAQLINAPLWVKTQYDAEIREAYKEAGTGIDLLAQAFGLLTTPDTLVAESAYINFAGQLEINPSGQIMLIPRATGELNQPNWSTEIEARRDVLKGETWESIVLDGLYPELVSARNDLAAKEKEFSKEEKRFGKLSDKQRLKAQAKFDQDKSAIESARQSLAELEKKLAPAIKRGLKKILSLNNVAEVGGKVPPPKGNIIFLTRSKARLKAYGLAHGLLQKQEAISGHVPIPMEPGETILDANGVSIAVGRPLNAQEIQQLFTAAQSILPPGGAQNIGYFPTAVGFKLVNFGVPPTAFQNLIQFLYSQNIVQGTGSTVYFKLNWDLGFYETNTTDASGLSEFEKQLRQSGFWAEFQQARDRIEPRSSVLSALWARRIDLANAYGGIGSDDAWTKSLTETGGVPAISRTQLTGLPALSIVDEAGLKGVLAGFVKANPNATAEQLDAEAAKLIRLDAYAAVEAQEVAENRVPATQRKKLVEQLAIKSLELIQNLPFVPEAMRLSMAEISIGKVTPDKKMKTVTEFLEWAERELGGVIGKADPADLTGDQKVRVANALYYFTLARLAAKNASGVDWYLTAVQASMAIVHNIHPELKADKDLERLYKAAIAVTSQGQRVEQNFVFADSVYRFYKEFGRLPDLVSFGGKSKPIIEQNFVKLQNLIDSRGLKGAMDLLEESKSAREVNALFREVLPEVDGKNKKLVSGEKSETMVRGAMLLGPKIGSFFGNLQFLFDTVTMDVWFTRTIQRILGRPFGITIGEAVEPRSEKLAEHGKSLSYTGLKGSLQRLLFAIEYKQEKANAASAAERRELAKAVSDAQKEYDTKFKNGNLTDSQKKELKRKLYYAKYELEQITFTREDKEVAAEIKKFLELPSSKLSELQTQITPLLARTIAYAEPVHREFAADGYKLKKEFNRAAKGIDEAFSKGQEAPTSGDYRNAIREIMDMLRETLKKDGIDLEQADLQAVLWYGEKDLYWMFGVADVAEGQDYAYSAAYLYAEKLSGRERPHRDIVGHKSIPGDIERFSSSADDRDEDEEDGDTSTVSLSQKTKRGRDPVLLEAAQEFAAGTMTGEDYRRLVDQRAPLGEFDEVPVPATPEQIAFGLGDRRVRADQPTLKRDLIIEPDQIGQRIVESRLDIPSYDERGIWVVSVHEDTGPLRTDFRGAGPVVGYTSAVRLRNVQFRTQQRAAAKIAAGASKNTIATMRGENMPQTSEAIFIDAQQALNDSAWVEVGFNPVRSSMFYRKDTGAPVTDAAEVIQVGGMVLARRPTSDESVVRLYQPVWYGSSEEFDRLSAHQAGEFSGLGWGLYFTDEKELLNNYMQASELDSLGNPAFGATNIYSVTIPDNDNLLDSDAPYEAQSEYIKQALSVSSVAGLDDHSKKVIASYRLGFTKSGASMLAKLGGGAYRSGRIEGGDMQTASRVLASLGIPGRRGAGWNGENYFVMWDDTAASINWKLQQVDEDEYRGMLTFDMAARGAARRTFKMSLGKQADASTFFHELMHYYLEVLGDVSTGDAAPQTIKDDMAAIVAWWQRRPGAIRKTAVQLARDNGAAAAADVIENLSDDEIQNALLNWRSAAAPVSWIGLAAHELLAENWEAYLYTGKAPIPELETIFQRIKKWLAKVYESITSIGLGTPLDLSDDIVRVFDRIVASEVEITAAEARESVEPMFSVKPDGMSDLVWEQYKTAIEKASARARELLGAELMASERAAMRKERAEFRERITGNIRTELYDQPEYIALYLLRSGRMPDGSEPIAPLRAFKLDKESLAAMPDITKETMKRLRSLGVYAREGGVTPDQAAEILGFESGKHLVDTLLEVRPLAEVVKERVKAAVEAEFPGLIDNPKELSAAASEAVRNEFREDVIAAELAELQRALRADKAALRRLANSVPRPLGAIATRILEGTETEADAAIGILGSYKLLRAIADEQAAAKLEPMLLREIRPNVFAVAAKKNAQAATRLAARGDYVGALSAKEAELANTALHRRAVEIRERAQKQAAWLESRNSESAQSKLGLAGGSYQAQMNDILERFNFRPIPLTQVDRLSKLREWVEGQKAKGFTVEIDEQILDEAFRKDFRQMTAAELDAVYLAARQIAHLAKTKLELKIGKERRQFAEVVETLVATIGANKKPIARPIGALSKSEKLQAKIAAGFGSMRKLASLVRELDGFNDSGPLYWAFMDPINQAGNNEAVMREKALLELNRIFGVYTREQRAEMGQRNVYMVNSKKFSLSKEDLLSMALNWGNEANRQRLITSNNYWNESDIVLLLKNLNRFDWDFVQSVWDHLESYWPEIEAKQKRVYGITPERVTPTPVITDHGIFRGGYYPLKYKGAKSEFETQADAAKAMMAGATGASTTRRGHLKARMDRVERPVRLGFDVLMEHLNQVIHDLTHHEMLIQTTRILRNRNVVAAIETYYGTDVVVTMQNLLDQIATGDTVGTEHGSILYKYLRNGAQTAVMGFNLMTSLQQVFGLTQSINRVGAMSLVKAVSRWLTSAPDAENTVEWVNSKSSFMRLRGKTQNRELNEIYNTIEPDARKAIRASFYYLILKGQMLADMPTWLAAYDNALGAGSTDEQAVALADQAVIDTQGSGMVKDLALAQQGGTFQRLFTLFYSYFSATYNLNVETLKGIEVKDKAELGRAMVDLLTLNSLPVAINFLVALSIGRYGGDDEDLLKKLAKEQFAFLMTQSLFTREFSGMLEGRDYEGPAGLRPIADIYKLAKAISTSAEDGEVKRSTLVQLNKVAGTLFHYPAIQLQRTIEGAKALWEGNTRNPLVLLRGPTKEERGN